MFSSILICGVREEDVRSGCNGVAASENVHSRGRLTCTKSFSEVVHVSGVGKLELSV